MKGLLLAAAVLANTIAAPQLRLTKKSYAGLEHALAGRIPVGIYSAHRIYQAYEDNENNVVVLNFPGLGSDYRLDLVPAAPSLPTSAARGAPIARTGVPAAVAEELADEATDDIVRRKRQDDDDDDVDDIFGSITTADRVSFALSGLGTILGINLGRWLDTTHEANVKLIDGMENVGTIVLDQVDNILERANDPNRTKSDKFNLF